MMQALPVAIAVLGTISTFLLVFSMIPAENVLKSRMQKLERVSASSLAERNIIIDQIVNKERKSSMRQRLNEAGWYDLTPTAFAVRELGALGIGISSCALLIVALHLSDKISVILGVMVALVAWRLPSIVLDRASKARKESIARALPDFLDLLSATVQAGLALNASLLQAVDATTGALKEELTSTLSEIRLGRSRADALNALAERANEPSLTKTVAAIAQAEKVGSNLAEVLEELSKDSRDHRWQRAEEKASQLHMKMILPMAGFMIPSLYLMIFGPVIAQLLEPK